MPAARPAGMAGRVKMPASRSAVVAGGSNRPKPRAATLAPPRSSAERSHPSRAGARSAETRAEPVEAGLSSYGGEATMTNRSGKGALGSIRASANSAVGARPSGRCGAGRAWDAGAQHPTDARGISPQEPGPLAMNGANPPDWRPERREGSASAKEKRPSGRLWRCTRLAPWPSYPDNAPPRPTPHQY
jgi:hypothetical protein